MLAQELPDLFSPDLTQWPELAQCRLYRGTQLPGDVCFNPSRCVHATRNLSLTISLTHNFIDGTLYLSIPQTSSYLHHDPSP